MNHQLIVVRGARENNLKNVSLSIPKHQITVFTGVSGSGKSSLVLDTIASKSRRELNDTFPTFVQQYLPKYGRPHVDAIENLPIAIVIDQRKPTQNSRSTVATYTDVAALLRLLFSRVGQPFVGYAESFSFNHPEGSCPRCSGLGEIRELDIHKLVDFDKSLNDEDTIHYIAFGKGGWRWIRYAHSGLFDLDKKIKDYTPEELDLFLNSPQIRLKNPPSNWPKTAKYAGLIPRMYRSIINSEEGLLHAAVLNPMLRMGRCPDCGGTRLSPRVLSCKIEGKNIADVSAMSITRLNAWIKGISAPLAADLKTAISARLTALEEIGLGYLSLDRGVGTLSGGEAQRCKIAKYINSSLSDVLYILDEPSTGLHDHDIELMRRSVRRLCDAGNTVLLVEHHRQMISMADHIVDMGPGPGAEGGRIVFQGSYQELLSSATATGRMLQSHSGYKPATRRPHRLASAARCHAPQPAACLHRPASRRLCRRLRCCRLGQELAHDVGRNLAISCAPCLRCLSRCPHHIYLAEKHRRQPALYARHLHGRGPRHTQALRQGPQHEGAVLHVQRPRCLPRLRRQRCHRGRDGLYGQHRDHLRGLRRTALLARGTAV